MNHLPRKNNAAPGRRIHCMHAVYPEFIVSCAVRKQNAAARTVVHVRKTKPIFVLVLFVCIVLIGSGCANNPNKQQLQGRSVPPVATTHGTKAQEKSYPRELAHEMPQSSSRPAAPQLDDRASRTTPSEQDRHHPGPQAGLNPNVLQESQPLASSGGKRLSPPPRTIRGIYLSSQVAASSDRMRSIHALLEQSHLNAVVVDINSGIRLTALPARSSSTYGPADSRGAEQLRAAVRTLKEHSIYLIARIVIFKDDALASARPDWAIRRKNGSLWRDRKGHAWIDPYKEEAWPYYQALMQEAAKAGFDEVQFDYVRFPENGAKVDREVAYANPNNVPKSRIISRFVRQATEHAHRLGLRASADVFGLVGSAHDDMGIGQRWTELAPATDVLSPMIYPSHYHKGIWGIRNPDLAPVAIITRALEDADKQNKALAGSGVRPAEIRPWLQGFTASWIHPHQSYGVRQIREQIQAARKVGFSSYLIWNPVCRYPVF